MKKNILITTLSAFLISGALVAQSIEGGSVAGVSASTLLDYFKLTGANIATGLNRFTGQTQLEGLTLMTNDVSIDNQAALTGGLYSGMRVQTTERASICIGPSDGQTREFCMSGGSVLQLHGANSDIYDSASTGNITLMSDSGLNRHWFAPTGSIVVAGGQQPPIESAFMVGSNLLSAATFSVDTTNDWSKHLPISAPAASECDSADEKGRLYFDSTANEFKFCNGTAWTSFGGGGGGPTTTMAVFDNQSDIADLYSDSNMRLSYLTAHKRLSLEILTMPSGSTNNVGVETTCFRPDNALNSIQTQAQITSTGSAFTIANQIGNVNDNVPATASCSIKAMDDSTWGYYEVVFVRASKQHANREHSIKVLKYSY